MLRSLYRPFMHDSKLGRSRRLVSLDLLDLHVDGVVLVEVLEQMMFLRGLVPGAFEGFLLVNGAVDFLLDVRADSNVCLCTVFGVLGCQVEGAIFVNKTLVPFNPWKILIKPRIPLLNIPLHLPNHPPQTLVIPVNDFLLHLCRD